MTLHPIEALAQRVHQLNDRHQQPRRLHADVLGPLEFRRKLGWGKNRFYAAARAGRFDAFIAVNLSTKRSVVYVRAKVDAWIAESPAVALRAREQR